MTSVHFLSGHILNHGWMTGVPPLHNSPSFVVLHIDRGGWWVVTSRERRAKLWHSSLMISLKNPACLTCNLATFSVPPIILPMCVFRYVPYWLLLILFFFLMASPKVQSLKVTMWVSISHSLFVLFNMDTFTTSESLSWMCQTWFLHDIPPFLLLPTVKISPILFSTFFLDPNLNEAWNGSIGWSHILGTSQQCSSLNFQCDC